MVLFNSLLTADVVESHIALLMMMMMIMRRSNTYIYMLHYMLHAL